MYQVLQTVGLCLGSWVVYYCAGLLGTQVVVVSVSYKFKWSVFQSESFEIQRIFSQSLCLLFVVLSIYNFGSSLAVLLELLRFVVHVTFLWQQCSVSHWSCSWQQFSYQIVACLRTFGSEHHLLRVPYCTSTFCSTLKVKDHCNLLG